MARRSTSIFALILAALAAGCAEPSAPDTSGATIADHTVALEAVLRSIPAEYVDEARNNFHVAYQHTSHGTHVSYGVFGLPGFQAGDEARFGVTDDDPAPGKLDFHDYAIAPSENCDLSTSDNAGWSSWIARNRAYLDADVNDSVNIVMWSWCDITGHDVDGYIASMQTLIGEYGAGGAKIGSGSGKTKSVPVDFIFMTGHANAGANTGPGNPRSQAEKILDYCTERGYYCLDYYGIDTHDMNGAYWEDAGDDGDSAAGGSFYSAWQTAHAEGADWYENRSSPGGAATYGAHTSQHITANRKAFAFWWILARIAGWEG